MKIKLFRLLFLLAMRCICFFKHLLSNQKLPLHPHIGGSSTIRTSNLIGFIWFSSELLLIAADVLKVHLDHRGCLFVYMYLQKKRLLIKMGGETLYAAIALS